MNEPTDEVTAELSRLRPAAPRAELTRRIREAVGQTHVLPRAAVRARRERGRWRWAWAPVGVACATVILVVFRPNPEAIQPAKTEEPAAALAVAEPDPAWRQVDVEHYLVHAEENGIIYAAETVPLRQLRYQVVDLSRWVDDREQMVIDVIRPREETLFLPVNVY